MDTGNVTMELPGTPPITLTPAQLDRAVKAMGKPKRTAGQDDIEDIAGPGHNGPETARVTGVATDRLRSIVDRIERLEDERRALASDIKDIYTEAQGSGFDPKVLRALIALRRKEPAEVEEQETLLDLYRNALG